MRTDAVDLRDPAEVGRLSSTLLRAAVPLTLAGLILVLVYAGAVANDGPVLGPWLDYLAPAFIPVDRLLTGALWLAVLVEVAAGDHAFFQARHRAVQPLVTALFAGAMFYALRDTRSELGDGPALLRDPVGAVVSGGYYTFVEELAGMWLPLRLARVRFQSGVPPVAAIVDGYRIVSIGFGMLYAAAVSQAARSREAPRRFALLLFGHAALLQFMGYVENYVGAFALLAFGFLRATSALTHGKVTPGRTLETTLLFSLAAVFHGVAVWSVFGLVILALHTEVGASRWAGFAKVAVANTLVGLVTLASAYALFRFYLTPGVGPVHVTPLLEGGRALPIASSISELFTIRPPRDHALALLRVGAPGLLAILAGALARPRAVAALTRARDVQLALAYLAGFLLHQLLWRSTLGIYRDWDLFGFTALPLGYLGARALSPLPRSRAVYAAAFVCCTLLGLSFPLTQSGAALSDRDRAPAPWER